MSDIESPTLDALLFPVDALPLPPIATYQQGEKALEQQEIEAQLQALGLAASGWQLRTENGRRDEILRVYTFDSYQAGVSFVSCIAAAADKGDHHPEITLSYREVELRWSTHFVKGIHRNDLSMAKYSDELFNALNHRSMS